MKGKSIFFDFFRKIFFTTLSKQNHRICKIKVFSLFKNGQKKMSKNEKPKKSLLRKNSLTIKKIYRHKLNGKNFFVIIIFLKKSI